MRARPTPPERDQSVSLSNAILAWQLEIFRFFTAKLGNLRLRRRPKPNVDDCTFVHRLQTWIKGPFSCPLVNEAKPLPLEFRSPLHRELTAEACDLLEQ